MAFVSFSTKERDQDYCRVIIEAFGYIERYLDGLSQGDFALDSKTQDAVTMSGPSLAFRGLVSLFSAEFRD
jgi:hypothetical protein